MNLITMVPATAKFFEQMRAMRRYIVENGVTEFAVFQNWCDENNRRGGGARIAIDRIDWQSGRRSSATADALTVGMAENVHKFLFRSSGWIR